MDGIKILNTMKNRRVIIWLSVLLPLAVMTSCRNVLIPWLNVMDVQWIYLLRTGAVLIVCCGLFYLFKPAAGCLFRIIVFLLALLFIL